MFFSFKNPPFITKIFQNVTEILQKDYNMRYHKYPEEIYG